MDTNKPTAADIYERQNMDAEGQGGSVQDDLDSIPFEDWEEYFGDLDPTTFL